MYTFLSPELARQWAATRMAPYGPNEVEPENLPDLLVLDWELENVADLTCTTGLGEVGLPSTYPRGFTATSTWTVTQSVGATIHNAGHTSILTRSASATEWSGQITTQAEMVVFTDQAPSPTLTKRIPFGGWA